MYARKATRAWTPVQQEKLVYANDFPGRLSSDSLLYTGDVKLIAPVTALTFSKTPYTPALVVPKGGS